MVIIHFLKLVRFPNLLIIALMQYLIRYFIIQPLIKVNGFDLLISNFDFFLLSLSTVLIAAAGYVINDYFDLKIDKINKPDKIIIDKYIKRRVAMGAHIVMNIIAIGLGAYVSHRVGNIMLVTILAFAAFSLWYYSTNLKYDLIIGNFVIALMAAFVPLIVGLYEIPLLNKWGIENFQIHKFNFDFNHVAYYTIGFGIFAFLMTFAREITKDCADIEGDSRYGASTITIVWGEKAAKIISSLFYIAVMIGLIGVQVLYLLDLITLGFVSILCILISYTIFITLKAKTKKQFEFASDLNKIITLLGILYTLIFPYILKQFMG